MRNQTAFPFNRTELRPIQHRKNFSMTSNSTRNRHLGLKNFGKFDKFSVGTKNKAELKNQKLVKAPTAAIKILNLLNFSVK